MTQLYTRPNNSYYAVRWSLCGIQITYCYFGQSPVGGGVNSAAALAAPSPHLICTFKYSQYFIENWNLPGRARVIVPTQDKFKF